MCHFVVSLHFLRVSRVPHDAVPPVTSSLSNNQRVNGKLKQQPHTPLEQCVPFIQMTGMAQLTGFISNHEDFPFQSTL